MNLEEGLYTLLSTNASITGLVSTRIYPLVIPEDSALPVIAYQRISSSRILAHDGPGGLATATVQLTIQGTSYTSTKAVAAAARALLNGYTGLMSTVHVERCALENELDSYEFETDAKVVRQDYSIMYKE